MAETTSDKPGFLGRLFGRKPAEPQANPRPSGPASQSEGEPDFTTAAAAGDLPPVEPTPTQASPDVAAEDKKPVELAGADLQPVETIEPEGGAPREPIPRA